VGLRPLGTLFSVSDFVTQARTVCAHGRQRLKRVVGCRRAPRRHRLLRRLSVSASKSASSSPASTSSLRLWLPVRGCPCDNPRPPVPSSQRGASRVGGEQTSARSLHAPPLAAQSTLRSEGSAPFCPCPDARFVRRVMCYVRTQLVPGSAADNSPLEVGEVIQSVNGTDCSYCSTDHLADLLLGPEGLQSALASKREQPLVYSASSHLRRSACAKKHSTSCFAVSGASRCLRCCCLPAFQCVDANHADRICGECPDHCAWGAAQVDQSRTRISRRGTSFALSLLSNNKISRIACFGEFRVAFP
jgi:hypothetical protein